MPEQDKMQDEIRERRDKTTQANYRRLVGRWIVAYILFYSFRPCDPQHPPRVSASPPGPESPGVRRPASFDARYFQGEQRMDGSNVNINNIESLQSLRLGFAPNLEQRDDYTDQSHLCGSAQLIREHSPPREMPSSPSLASSPRRDGSMVLGEQPISPVA